jgi:hypothetical protein
VTSVVFLKNEKNNVKCHKRKGPFIIVQVIDTIHTWEKKVKKKARSHFPKSKKENSLKRKREPLRMAKHTPLQASRNTLLLR